MSTENTSDPLLTVKGLSEIEGVTEHDIRKCISRKGLPHYRMAGIRIRLSEYRNWLATRQEGDSAAAITKSVLELALEAAHKAAPKLRAQGILTLAVPGLRIELLPLPAKVAEVDSDNDRIDSESRLDPMDDCMAFGRPDGFVPGFPKLREVSEDGE